MNDLLKRATNCQAAWEAQGYAPDAAIIGELRIRIEQLEASLNRALTHGCELDDIIEQRDAEIARLRGALRNLAENYPVGSLARKLSKQTLGDGD